MDRELAIVAFGMSLALVQGGCTSSEPPTPSHFIQTADPEAIVKRARIEGVDVSPQFVCSETQDRERGSGAEANTEAVFQFRCDSSKLPEFGKSLVKVLKGQIESQGGKVRELKLDDQNWTSSPLAMEYTSGNTQGNVRIWLAKAASSDYPHQLTISIDELTEAP